MTSKPILQHPDLFKPFIIGADCSQYSIGAVLQQEMEGSLHPIPFESKKLTETEQRYSAQERKLLAIKYVLNHWRHIIDGATIIIRTDNESLKLFRIKAVLPQRLTQCINEIEHYDPALSYRPGKLQVVPDGLSRRPGNREEGEPADIDRFVEVEEVAEKDDDDAEGEESILMSKARIAEMYARIAMHLVRGGADGLVQDKDRADVLAAA
jgi:RNase H-like domain found in reverse transcriptase